MKKLLIDFAHLFFPKLCVLCSNPLMTGEEQLCLHCLSDLPYTRYQPGDGNPAEQLFYGKVHLEQATALFHYEKGGKVQKIVHAIKYHDKRELAFLLGKHAATLHPPGGVDLLLPVPLHPKRQRKRGYNQSEILCEGMAAVWRLPIDAHSLQRSIPSTTQTSKGLFDRWENVRNIFTADPYPLQGKHVLLVDDVITSGSTLLSCAEVLLTIPGVKVSVMAVAIT